jgi:DHA2 family multidrug resistance protein
MATETTTKPAEEPTEIRGHKGLVTLAVMLAALMAMLDISIVNVALNDIRASFGTPIDQIGWISVGYMMANIVVIPLTGWLQRRFGFRRYFVISLLVFTAASALCGLAWDLPSLVFARVLQGIGGGAIIPTSQGILFARYPRSEHAMAGALFGLGAITGPLLGPTIGGHMIDIASWHWIFYVNVPIGLGAAALAWRVIEQPTFTPTRDAVDWTGIGLLAVGMSTLQYTLEEGHRDGWFESPLIAFLAVTSFISLVTFVVHELETPNPVVDFRVFLNRSYAAGSFINFLVGMTLFSGSFLFSLFCGTVLRFSALDIGLVFLEAGLIQVVLMPLVGRFASRFDGRVLVLFGIAVVGYSMWVNTQLTGASGFDDLVLSMRLRAFGLPFIFVPLSVLSLSNVSNERRPNATGLFNLTRELGGSIGTAWMSTLLDHVGREQAAYLGEHVTATSAATSDAIAAAQHGPLATVADPAMAAIASLAGRVQGQAMIRAFEQSFAWATVVFLTGLVIVLLIERPRSDVKVEGAH